MQDHHEDRSQCVEVVVQLGILACRQTPAGTWLCCAKQDGPNCGHGITLEFAATNWERAQELDQ